jgi:hypothetical protein
MPESGWYREDWERRHTAWPDLPDATPDEMNQIEVYDRDGEWIDAPVMKWARDDEGGWIEVPDMRDDYTWNEARGDWDVEEVQKTERKLQNPEDDARYKQIKKKISDREAMIDWKAKRLPPNQYRAAIDRLQAEGFNNVTLQPYEDGDFWAMKVTLPDNFPHMNNTEGLRRKQFSTPYHISLSLPGILDAKERRTEGYKAALKSDIDQYFDDFFDKLEYPEWEWWATSETNANEGTWLKKTHKPKTFNFPHEVHVTSGSTVGMHDYSVPFVRRGNELQQRGTDREDAFHMSVD